MTTPQTAISGPRVRARVGVKDGGHVLFRCSNCRKPLCDLHVTRPDKPLVWRMRAKCCFGCTRPGGRPEYSFIETITGLFHLGGDGVPNPDDPEDSTVNTVPVQVVDDVDGEGNPVFTIEVAEARK